jgi:cytochrome c peroxidase
LSGHLSRHARRASVLLAAVGLCSALASPTVGATDSIAELFDGRLPNNFPFLNGAGTAATTDPGRARRSGRWGDMDLFKTPSLRGLAARAPYFHNGIAANLTEAVRHYEVALNFQYTDQERADLVAFLEAL